MSMWLGDYEEDETVHFMWATNDSSGASITRATDGTISVYKDNGLTQTTAGITDTEDFDSLTGIHAVTIDLSSDAFYATGADYSVVLSGATIDGQSVNAVLAHFSIENRYQNLDVGSTPIVEPSNIFSWPATLEDVIAWLGAVSRNAIEQTATVQSVKADDESTDIATANVSDNGTTFTRGEFTSGA